MGKVWFQLSVSLDGYAAGPHQSVDDPIGVGGLRLFDWQLALEAWRRRTGQEGGEVNASTPVFEQAISDYGAVVMGRNMFGGGRGPWPDDPPWRGWWATSRRITRRCSCSPISPASRSPCWAGRRSSSSPTGPKPPCSRPGMPPGTRTS